MSAFHPKRTLGSPKKALQNACCTCDISKTQRSPNGSQTDCSARPTPLQYRRTEVPAGEESGLRDYVLVKSERVHAEARMGCSRACIIDGIPTR